MTSEMKCAKEIARYLHKYDLEEDTCIYVDGWRYTVKDGKLVEDIECDPRDYLDYCGTYLSMSFEGPFYDVIENNWTDKYLDKLGREFSSIIEKYGKYYERGNSWNLSLHDC